MEFGSPFAYVGPGFGADNSVNMPGENPYDLANDGISSHFRIDTNAIRISMDVLEQEPKMKTKSIPITCLMCEAVYGATSEPVKPNAKWICEYCGQENDVREAGVSPKTVKEFQQSRMTDYHQGGAESTDQSSLTIFAIDVSGSMCQSCPVDGTDKYISRLEAIQQTVVSQIQRLHSKNPHAKVGIITFSDAVDVHGDASSTVIKIADDSLFEYDRLLEIGERLNNVRRPLSQSHQQLIDRAKSLSANGQTAMGPALLVALGIAGRESGSSIIVCTDGLSNVGVGALSKESSSLEREFAKGMFQRAGSFAIEMGVCVSVVSIKGEECNLAEIGSLAEATGGRVHRVDLAQLNEVVTELTSCSSIATNVEARLFLHTSQYPYMHAIPAVAIDGLCSQTKVAASVSPATDIYFQYGPATQSRIKDLPLRPSNPFRLPVQLQIKYTRNGVRRMLVIFDDLPIADDIRQAVSDIHLELMTRYAARTSAEMALAGDFNGAWQLAELYKHFFEFTQGDHPQDAVYDHYATAIGVLGGSSSKAAAPSGSRLVTNATYAYTVPATQTSVPEPVYRGESLFIEDQTAEGLFQMMNMGSRVRSRDVDEGDFLYDTPSRYRTNFVDVVDLTSFDGPSAEHLAMYDTQGSSGNPSEPLYATIDPA